MRRMAIAEKLIMKNKDNRVKYLTEVLHGINVVKLFAWETQMAQRIFQLRALEVAQLKRYGVIMSYFNDDEITKSY
jgi:hypothetical protein